MVANGLTAGGGGGLRSRAEFKFQILPQYCAFSGGHAHTIAGCRLTLKLTEKASKMLCKVVTSIFFF